MSEAVSQPAPEKAPAKAADTERGANREFLVSAAPHLAAGWTTRRIMFNVVGAMLPMLVVALC